MKSAWSPGIGLVFAILLGCGTSTVTTTTSLAPAATSLDDAGGAPETAPAPLVPPDFCVAAKQGSLQDIVTTPKAPYFVHHPDASVTAPEAIVFVPGGPGSRDTAMATFELWLSRGKKLGNFRIIVPYAADDDLTDEGKRIVPILDEVLACHGGAQAPIHLAGTSNGGRAAFALMLASHERFATLLGSPGLFADVGDDVLVGALSGKRVFNGAGALDTQWNPLVRATNERLTRLGIDSRFVEMPGQGHILGADADQDVFFDFWSVSGAETGNESSRGR